MIYVKNFNYNDFAQIISKEFNVTKVMLFGLALNRIMYVSNLTRFYKDELLEINSEFKPDFYNSYNIKTTNTMMNTIDITEYVISSNLTVKNIYCHFTLL